jgi:hypothetical protein
MGMYYVLITSHILQNTQDTLYWRVLRVRLLFYEKYACLGAFLVVGTLTLPSNISDAPFWRVFGGRHLPFPTPHPQPPKMSHCARFLGDNNPSFLLLSSLSLLIPFLFLFNFLIVFF